MAVFLNPNCVSKGNLVGKVDLLSRLSLKSISPERFQQRSVNHYDDCRKLKTATVKLCTLVQILSFHLKIFRNRRMVIHMCQLVCFDMRVLIGVRHVILYFASYSCTVSQHLGVFLSNRFLSG